MKKGFKTPISKFNPCIKSNSPIQMKLSLHLPIVEPISDEYLYKLSLANKQLRIERNKYGELLIRFPLETETSFYFYDIGFELGIWNREHKLGKYQILMEDICYQMAPCECLT